MSSKSNKKKFKKASKSPLFFIQRRSKFEFIIISFYLKKTDLTKGLLISSAHLLSLTFFKTQFKLS